MIVEHLNFGWLHAPPHPPACCHCIHIRDGNRSALIDTGIGLHDIQDPIGRVGEVAMSAAGFKFLPAVAAITQLRSMNVQPHEVTDIVLTHCDPDHVGGLADFPSAHVHLSHEELIDLRAGNPRYRSVQFSHGPNWVAYAQNDCDFFGIPARRVRSSLDVDVRLVPLFGHTHGHCGVAVRVHGRWTFHVGDAYYLRGELSDLDHPVDALARLRAEDDALRRSSLDRIRDLVSLYGSEIQINGYHDASELPPEVPSLDELANK